MASLSTILGLIATKVEALPGAPLAFPGGDWRDDLASIGPQSDAYQLRAQHQLEVIRSNVSYQTAAVEVVMYHHLLNSEAATERAFTTVQMLLDQAELLDRNWWNSIAGIYQLEPDNGRPELEQDVERVGNIVDYSVLCQFEIVPD